MKKFIKKVEGFTLVELIVVIAILGILAAVAVPAYTGYIKKANDASVNTTLSAVKTAAEAANATNGAISEITVSANGQTITVKAADMVSTFGTDFVLYYGSGEAGDVTDGTPDSCVITLTAAPNKWADSSYKIGAKWTGGVWSATAVANPAPAGGGEV